MAIDDGTTNPDRTDFYFLPPLADKNPSIDGVFNPYLLPEMRVCAIEEADLSEFSGSVASCEGKEIVETLTDASVDSDAAQYAFSWDTDSPTLRRLQREDGRDGVETLYLVLEIIVAGDIYGALELDPQNPQGPGQSTADAYAFRVGETIPVKFWLSADVRCVVDGQVVLECITGAVVDDTGAKLELENEGYTLAVEIFPTSLNGETILVTLERIDPVAFAAAPGNGGEECLPGLGGLVPIAGFDAPTFGDCFRVTTFDSDGNPILVELDNPAIVSICIPLSDAATLPGIDVEQGQNQHLQMVRYNEDGGSDGGPIWEALENVTSLECGDPGSTALLDVPDEGLMRYAALGVNAVADLFLPDPVAARDVRFGGYTSSFSRFQYALPGQFAVTSGDSAVLQAGENIFGDGSTNERFVDVTINISDIGLLDESTGDVTPLPVANATVHFSGDNGRVLVNGIAATEATSDESGDIQVQWVFPDSEGEKKLRVEALGLTTTPVTNHDSPPEGEGSYEFLGDALEVTATVVGPPANLVGLPEGPITATAGESTKLEVTVLDSSEPANEVVGTPVTWTCTGTCYFSESENGPFTEVSDGGTFTVPTNENGVAVVWWKAETAGSQASIASVGGSTVLTTCGDAGATPCYEFTATILAAPAATLTADSYDTNPYVGSDVSLRVVVEDEFGNKRSGEAVTWTVLSGGGSVNAGTEEADSSVSNTWTVGGTPGVTQEVLVSVDRSADGLAPLTYTYTLTGRCFDGWGTPTGIDGDKDAGWSCASEQYFEANISGGKTDAYFYWMNDADNLYLAVRVQQDSDSKANDVRFDFDNNADQLTALYDDAIGVENGQFIDEHLDEKCLNRNQSGCGSRDTKNGEGAAAWSSVDGGWTTFELSHPLTSADGAFDINVLPENRGDEADDLGFYVTLQQGNGAQGNTQYPDFRGYFLIKIVTPNP